jgi:Icc-related predicted phosphoesterase
MEFIYATDLHGNHSKYKYLKKICIEQKIPILHIGADILPKIKGEIIPKVQKEFIDIFLRKFYTEAKQNNLTILTHFGNDDLYSLKNTFLDYAQLLDYTSHSHKGFTFKAYGYVPDYPYPLKTACKLDDEDFIRPSYKYKTRKPDFNEMMISQFMGREIEYKEKECEYIPIDINPNGQIYTISDPEYYFNAKSTIAKDLKNFHADNKTIVSIHCPPSGCDLDVCRNGYKAGSKAIRQWAETNNPLLILSGHIHENYAKTNKWKEKIGNTLVIQPGQGDSKTVHFVHIKINEEINEITSNFFIHNL